MWQQLKIKSEHNEIISLKINGENIVDADTIKQEITKVWEKLGNEQQVEQIKNCTKRVTRIYRMKTLKVM